MARLSLALLTASFVAAASAADTYFSDIYGDTNADPAYVGADLTDRPEISGTDWIQGEVGTVGGKGFQVNGAAELTEGSPTGAVSADFAAHQAVSVTYEDTQGSFTPTQVLKIRSFGGNADTRNWQNLTLEWKDGTGGWNQLFADSRSFGHMYAMIENPDEPGEPFWNSNIAAEFPSASLSLIEIFNSDGGLLFGGETVYGLRFNYWLVSSWGSQILPSQDEFDKGFDPIDGDAAPQYADVTGSVIQEIDVFVPEPTTLTLLALGALGLIRRR
jgi:hypothetical protein